MRVRRIENFNLADRPLFSGIYGPGVKDDYIGPDLRRYGIWEMLFLTFRSQGFHVVFYSQDPSRNFFSFRKDDLVELFNLRNNSSKSTIGGRYVANIASPFGGRRRKSAANQSLPPDDTDSYMQIQECLKDTNRVYYRIRNNVDIFETITRYISEHSERKMVFVFSSAFTDMYEHPENILPRLNNLKTTFNSTNCQAHIVALYDTEDFKSIFENGAQELFRGKFFEDALIGADAPNGRGNQLFCIAGPGRDEYRNLLNRVRLLEGYSDLLAGRGIEEKAVRLSQQVTQRTKDRGAYVGEKEMLNYYLKLADL